MKKKYKVIGDSRLSFLTHDVEKYLNEGWNCVGGIATCIDGDGDIYYHQAMMKDETDVGGDTE